MTPAGAPARLRRVLVVLASSALGGVPGGVAAEAAWRQGLRGVIVAFPSTAAASLLVGLFAGVFVSILLLAADAKGRAPRTGLGWSMAGFAGGGMATLIAVGAAIQGTASIPD